ncbi:trifunctional dihydropteroate synthetase [Saxophila tyrrhenica]|uniref:Folic acid synthesis protein FOL1 n=1 Tax=Saxophila tyrrhenica TaxID=1690608 RepID=A0AAV9P3A9_9PEZI|nr:trifunctional dihydropteroate synthetase [Saxophila tyrrhenica]
MIDAHYRPSDELRKALHTSDTRFTNRLEVKLFIGGTTQILLSSRHRCTHFGADASSGAWIDLTVRLTGRLSNQQTSQTDTLASQLEYLHQAVVDTVRSLKESKGTENSEPSTFDVSAIARALVDQRHRFVSVMDIQWVEAATVFNERPLSKGKATAEVETAERSSSKEDRTDSSLVGETAILNDTDSTAKHSDDAHELKTHVEDAENVQADGAEDKDDEMSLSMAEAEAATPAESRADDEVAKHPDNRNKVQMFTENAESDQADQVDDGTTLDMTNGEDAMPTGPDDGMVFIALGSNVGDRLKNIEDACNLMDADPDVRVLRTSSLYETPPMYVEDQERFLNGVCEIATKLQPIHLLDRLQAIEQQLGRVKLIEKGPRTVDLDILFYRDERMNTERLVLPHPLMMERDFVLRPFYDLIQPSRRRGLLGESVEKQVTRAFHKIKGQADPSFAHTPLAAGSSPLQSDFSERQTRVMSILNTTPDSFSDGGTHDISDGDGLRRTIESHVAAGATMIDVGGQSSRPNAPDITADEEIARVVPAIEMIRSLPGAEKITISIDTYRAAVAEVAVNTGAHVVNDISAGQLDPDMLPTVARLGCTYVMMHMRGTPSTMQSEENTQYPNGLITTIRDELGARIDAAMEAGIRRWRIILDPGIGFSKTQQQNLEILQSGRGLHKGKCRNMPWLVGSSRKGFVGKITGVEEPRERTWGTAATVTAAIRGGADIVRVHDVKEMVEVAKMADAIYRR